MVLVIHLFVIILLYIFIVYFQNYNFFYNSVLCSKNPINLLSKGLLNNKLFYYYGDVKIQELSYRIQFLLNNFDKIDLQTVKYLQKDSSTFKQNPYGSFYHPHFLIELKNNIDDFNNFYINFQISTKSDLGFEKLAEMDLNMNENRIQYISPYIRVYVNNMVEILENEQYNSVKFISKNKEKIDSYVFNNLKEYVSDIEVLKK